MTEASPEKEGGAHRMDTIVGEIPAIRRKKARPFHPRTIKISGKKPVNAREFPSPPRAESMFAEREVAQRWEPKVRNSLAQSVHVAPLHAVSSVRVLEVHSVGDEHFNIGYDHSAAFDHYSAYADDERQEKLRRAAHPYECSHYPAR